MAAVKIRFTADDAAAARTLKRIERELMRLKQTNCPGNISQEKSMRRVLSPIFIEVVSLIAVGFALGITCYPVFVPETPAVCGCCTGCDCGRDVPQCGRIEQEPAPPVCPSPFPSLAPVPPPPDCADPGVTIFRAAGANLASRKADCSKPAEPDDPPVEAPKPPADPAPPAKPKPKAHPVPRIRYCRPR
ncbi:MAG: hypothetical protein KY476_00710 [Planctomycetes bacterium]|nr:hypothetical protein [Planctomycetota bacterium]